MKNLLFVSIIFLVIVSAMCENKVSIHTPDNSQGLVTPSISQNNDNSPKDAKFYFNEGLKLQAAGEPLKAIEQFKKAIELGMNDKEMYRRVGEAYINLKQYDEAKVHLYKIIEIDPKDAQAHWALAKILVDEKNYTEGLKEGLLAKENYAKKDGYVYDYLIGIAYEGIGEYDNAIKHYKSALNGRSTTPDSTDYKEIKNRLSQLEQKIRDN